VSPNSDANAHTFGSSAFLRYFPTLKGSGMASARSLSIRDTTQEASFSVRKFQDLRESSGKSTIKKYPMRPARQVIIPSNWRV
jgi:hypothetical protein